MGRYRSTNNAQYDVIDVENDPRYSQFFDKPGHRQLQKDNYQRKTSQPKSGYGAVVPVPQQKPIVYLTERQRLLGSTIYANTLSFATGPAGTGKTHIALAVAVVMLKMKLIKHVVCLNPDVEIGTKMGFLPGSAQEKIAPSVRPMRDILNKLLSVSHVENLERAGTLLFEPLGRVLGTTFDDAFIVFDEAQNSTPEQMKALLTRVGKRSKIAVCGDYFEQKFIDGPSGLEDAITRLGHLPNIGLIDFLPEDIVRSEFCKQIILAYRAG